MSKKITYSIKATVTKTVDSISSKYYVVVTGSGYEGSAEGYSLGSAFEDAYEDLMMRVSEAIFTETDAG